jgi:hypothetical protein
MTEQRTERFGAFSYVGTAKYRKWNFAPGNRLVRKTNVLASSRTSRVRISIPFLLFKSNSFSIAIDIV